VSSNPIHTVHVRGIRVRTSSSGSVRMALVEILILHPQSRLDYMQHALLQLTRLVLCLTRSALTRLVLRLTLSILSFTRLVLSLLHSFLQLVQLVSQRAVVQQTLAQLLRQVIDVPLKHVVLTAAVASRTAGRRRRNSQLLLLFTCLRSCLSL